MQLADLRGQCIAILGAGREGLATVHALQRAEIGCQLTVLDESDLPDLPAGVTGRKVRLSEAQLNQFDTLVRSPGISCYRPELVAARAAGVAVTTGTNLWFAGRPDSPVIAVTGTKGKSTTCSLIAHLLQSAGHKVELAGNIGRPLLDVVEPFDYLVVELSSYQLADFEGEVDLAVLTNLRSDHLDWHGGQARYEADKLRLLARASACVVQAADRNRPSVRAAAGSSVSVFAGDEGWTVDPDRICCRGQRLFAGPRWSLPGRHNRTNLAAAIAAVDAMGVNPGPGLECLEQFRTLPHRLQTVVDTGGLRCVDDSIATTPESVVAALESFSDTPLVLICGGYDRGLDWTPLTRYLDRRPVTAVIAQGQCAPRIQAAWDRAGLGQPLHCVETLVDAVELALQMRHQGVLLLSPGAPSFDQYADFASRGDDFARLCAGISSLRNR